MSLKRTRRAGLHAAGRGWSSFYVDFVLVLSGLRQIVGVTIRKAENNPPVGPHRHGPEAPPVAPERMQMETGHAHVLDGPGLR
jgi:hypothetical protein